MKLTEFPVDITRKLPRYPLVPATLLGRLAVDQNYQGRGYGRFLLADALFRAVRSEIASFAVVVDAKDEAARRFYERESFLPFPDRPIRLFRPMADIENSSNKNRQGEGMIEGARRLSRQHITSNTVL